jgi:hypothetical protein
MGRDGLPAVDCRNKCGNSMELTRKTKLRTSNSDNILRYENNYTLNIEKSLRKKLESTKRPEIVYTKTGGGVTVKLDAVTFVKFSI